MLDEAKNLPNDPAALKGLVASLASELKFRDILIEKLKHQLAGMRQHRFGSRSEALDQLALEHIRDRQNRKGIPKAGEK